MPFSLASAVQLADEPMDRVGRSRTAMSSGAIAFLAISDPDPSGSTFAASTFMIDAMLLDTRSAAALTGLAQLQ